MIGKLSSQTFQINYTSNLGSYLGFPLKPKYSTSDFNFIIHNIRQRLQGWKMSSLSFSGRNQLITATLNQIPNYYMRVFNLPKKIHILIDKLNRNFLWGHFDTTNKLHLISWDKITKHKNERGLGIKKSKIVNVAYMSKLRWELHSNINKPWVKFLTCKYNYTSIPTTPCNSSFIFRRIFKDMNLFNSNTSYIVRNGNATSLWYDRWISNQPLRSLLTGPLPKDEDQKTIASILSISNDHLS